MKAHCAGILVALATTTATLGQGTFQNLGFEQATVFGDPTPAAGALPFWVGYINGVPIANIFYNDVSIGGAAVSIHDTSSHFYPALLGSYSVLLQGSGAGPATSAAIAQTGQLPSDAVSIRFWASPLSNNLQVWLDGQSIPLFILGAGPSYNILGGDITVHAGQTRELRFVGPANGGGFFDNIQFSNQPIPEPSAVSLLFGGLSFVAFRHWRRAEP